MNTVPEQIDFDDMQGLLRFGHGRLVEAEFLLLRIADRTAAGTWFASAPVTSARTQDAPPSTALQIAFTAAGLRALGLDDATIEQFPQPFLAGMGQEDSRSRRLGDTGANDPANWVWNGDEAHVLLMLYATKGGLSAWTDHLLTPPFETAFHTLRHMPTRPSDGIEPFGFTDGISEPKIDWQQTHPPAKHGREDYSNLISPGEVVLGHLNEYNERAPTPVIGDTDLGRGSTYLVMRQLAQDVPGFWRYIDHASGGDPGHRERLSASMVGRTRDGTPLIRDRRDIEGSAPGNDFDYADDVNGVGCPLGAHVRRANPRTGDQPRRGQHWWHWIFGTLGFRRRVDRLAGRHDLVASTRFHRLVRRGRVYGSDLPPDDALKADPDTDERGIFFICLCADIVRQFEFVQNAWIAAPKFNGLDGEADPLLGNRDSIGDVATGGFSIQRADGLATRHPDLPRFVTVRGGGYFFLPGLRALKIIASQTT